MDAEVNESSFAGNFSDVFPVVHAMDIIITIAGILGNGLVCAVFLSNLKVGNSATNKLILHQSVIDLTAVLIFLAARVIFHPAYQDVPTGYAAGKAYCKAWYTDYFLWGMYYTSTFNLVLIAMERYAVSCHVVWYRNFRLRGINRVGFLLPWLLGFGTQTYVFVLADSYSGWCYFVWPTEKSRVAGGIALYFFMFLLPLTVMCWCYCRVIRVLRKREVAQRQAVREDNILQRSKNVASTFVIITIAYVICCMPAETDYLLFNLGLNDHYGDNVYYIFSILTSLNMVVNPCIYTCRYKLFQRRLRKFLSIRRSAWHRNRVGFLRQQQQQ